MAPPLIHQPITEIKDAAQIVLEDLARLTARSLNAILTGVRGKYCLILFHPNGRTFVYVKNTRDTRKLAETLRELAAQVEGVQKKKKPSHSGELTISGGRRR